MRALLPGLAALVAAGAIAASPAAAERWSDPGFGAAANVSVHRGGHSGWSSAGAGSHHRGEWTDDKGRHRRHGDRDRGGDFRYPLYAGGWDYYDINRSWGPDSYNDWWHDRPSRSQPRWVRDNANCERLWWSGGGWRC